MSGQLFSSSDLDADGRQLVLTNNILQVFHYDAANESWDKNGSAGQSWYDEIFVPSDSFDSTSIASDKWDVLDTPAFSVSTVEQADNILKVGVERDEGIVGLSSKNKWRLSGDFDIRLYIDWDEYYNEYRSISHTFLKVGYDNENAVRVSFKFNGEDGYSFVSQKTVDRDLLFFDWKPNGAENQVIDINAAKVHTYFKITRQSGVIKTFVFNGLNSIQVGSTVSGTVFSNDLFVEFGVETKEYNTYRSAFEKFFIADGSVTPTQKFFSSTRGERQSFPDSSYITVDQQSLSIIDADSSKLWMRVIFGPESPLFDNSTRVSACNGIVYCTTVAGLVAFDFPADAMYFYHFGGNLLKADEPIALRNSEPLFRNHIVGFGSLLANSLNSVACRNINGSDYVVVSTNLGINVFRHLVAGMANITSGPLPATKIKITEKAALYWIGYNPNTNVGEVSFFSNITALSAGGSFSRSGFYGTGTALKTFGENLTEFDALTVNGVDLLAVGSTEGLSFIGISPGTPFTGSVSFGVSSNAPNPFIDPSLEQPLGITWRPFVQDGRHKRFQVRRSTGFSSDPDGDYSMFLRFLAPNATGMVMQPGMRTGFYQDNVDLTGVGEIYFDANFPSAGGTARFWDFQVLVDDTVVRTVADNIGPATRIGDFADVSAFTGPHRLTFQIKLITSISSGTSPVSNRHVYIDNIRTRVGNPNFRILPPGNVSIQEVLLQYDSGGHKVYFSTLFGYGAIDLDTNTLDYFVSLSNFIEGAENISGDFSRVESGV